MYDIIHQILSTNLTKRPNSIHKLDSNSIHKLDETYTPLPGVKTALAFQTSLILVVELNAVCRCAISGAQADSEARILGITMTARVDIVTSNPQTA